MSRLGKSIVFLSATRGEPQRGTISYVHPKGRFLKVTYQVDTLMGISPPLHECLRIVQGVVWTGMDGKPK